MTGDAPSRRSGDRAGRSSRARRATVADPVLAPAPSRRAPAAEPAAVLAVFVGAEQMGRGLSGDAGVEAVFLGEALEAVAEIAEHASSPLAGPAVVVFGPRAASSRTTREDVEAIRFADPEAVVIAGVERGEVDHGLFDAVVRAETPAAVLRRVIVGLAGREARGEAGAHAGFGPADLLPDEPDEDDAGDGPIVTTVPGAVPSRGARRPGTRSEPEAEPIGDGELAEAVASGADPIPAAVALIARRLGRDDVRFTPETGGAKPPEGASACSVSVGGRCVGRLHLERGRGDGPAEAELARHSAWLSGWLRLAEQNRSLRRAAFTDALTGAWNRRYCDRFLVASIARARRERQALTVLYFDIDEFKQYNDSFGHAAGDEILVEVVKALQSVIRPSDRVCRIGGDEFVVIFDEPSGPRRADSRPPESVYVLTKRVQQKIRERAFPKLGREAAGKLTISGGLATYPWDGQDAVTLLRRADELAMQSKSQGKNAITLGPGAEKVCEQDARADAPDLW